MQSLYFRYPCLYINRRVLRRTPFIFFTVVGLIFCFILWRRVVSGDKAREVHQNVEVHVSLLAALVPKVLLSPLKSTYKCIGNQGKQSGWQAGTCELRDVCYLSDEKAFSYFTTRREAEVLFGAKKDGYNIKLAGLGYAPGDVKKSAAERLNDRDLQPFPVVLNFETDLLKDTSLEWEDTDTIIYQAYSPWNIGHLFNDDFYPIFNAMALFDMSASNVQLVLQDSCENHWLYPGDPIFIASCNRVLAKWMPILKMPWMQLSHLRTRCFKRIVFGLYPLSWTNSGMVGKGMIFRDMTETLISNAGIVKVSLSVQGVLIPIKRHGESRRRILNANAIATAIEQHFCVPTQVLDLSALSLKEELAALRSASVILTGDGGAAWTTVFSSLNAVVIYVDFYDYDKGQSACVECWWTHLPQLQVLQYEVSRTEIVNNHETKDWMAWRNQVDYILNIDKALNVVHKSLLLTESQFAWASSFCTHDDRE